MTSKQIAVKLIGQKIKEPEIIFKNLDIFKSILPWCRDAAREYFETQSKRKFLVYYIDDIAPTIDNYMITRADKFYIKAFKKRNKLCESLCSSEKVISWLVDRWINTFINLTTNPKYLDFIDIVNLRIEFFDDNYSYLDNNIEINTEFEKAKELPKEEKIKYLKEVWEEARYDDFDELDMFYLVEKLDLKLDEVFKNKGELSKLNLKKEQVLNGGSQLVLLF